MDLSISPSVALKGVYRRNSIFVVGGTLEQIMNTVVGSEGFLGGIWGREWVGFGLVAAGGGVCTKLAAPIKLGEPALCQMSFKLRTETLERPCAEYL